MSILRSVGAAVCLSWFAILFSASGQTIEVPRQTKKPATSLQKTVSSVSQPQAPNVSRATGPQLQLVDIATIDPTIVIDLRYATDHNVTGRALYPSGTRAQVLPSVAQQLAGAQTWLKQFRYRLKIWDAYRPKAAQELLWKYAAKDQYVASPEKGFGSTHSYGVSVDATLIDDWSQEVTMPTKFDEFTPQAMMRYTGSDPLVRQHLNLLQKAMCYNNFYGLSVEWWHFTTADWKKYVPYWEDPTMSQSGDTPAPKS